MRRSWMDWCSYSTSDALAAYHFHHFQRGRFAALAASGVPALQKLLTVLSQRLSTGKPTDSDQQQRGGPRNCRASVRKQAKGPRVSAEMDAENASSPHSPRGGGGDPRAAQGPVVRTPWFLCAAHEAGVPSAGARLGLVNPMDGIRLLLFMLGALFEFEKGRRGGTGDSAINGESAVSVFLRLDHVCADTRLSFARMGGWLHGCADEFLGRAWLEVLWGTIRSGLRPPGARHTVTYLYLPARRRRAMGFEPFPPH